MIIKFIKNAMSGILLSVSLMVSAQGIVNIAEVPLGSVLSKQEFDALGTLKSVQIEDKKYFIIPAQDGKNFTTVIDSNYKVGRTENQISIVEQPTEKVRSQLSTLLGKAVTVKYYDHMNITLIRYANVEQAAAALKDIREAMPGAAVGLPITFSQPRIQ